jgi:hypothetical protein
MQLRAAVVIVEAADLGQTKAVAVETERELTAGGEHRVPVPHPESLLVPERWDPAS